MNAEDRAQSYATAFFEAGMQRWIDSLTAVQSALEADAALAARLQDTARDFADRQLSLDGLFPGQVDQPVRNLCYALLERGDLRELPGIIVALRQRLQESEATTVLVEITSAVPLEDGQKERLVAGLREEYGAGLDVRYRVDPKILGGLVVRVGDKLVDGSLATRLAAMRQSLGVTSRD
jgi:F-type H+-transporting ATPase subunit delta